MFYIGIDFGGTFISAGIVDENGNILFKKSAPTLAGRHYSEIIKDMASLCEKLIFEVHADFKDIKCIGIGSPGKIDTENGIIVYVNNLNFDNVNMKKEFSKFFDIPVFIENDANCAALGESVSGACKGLKDSITITLGTGIGGGIIIGGKIYRGSFFCGGEIGHMVIEHNGRKCSCGRKGCFESYCSTSALTRRMKEILEKNVDSEIFKNIGGDIEKADTKMLFEFYKKGDFLAKEIVDEYMGYLADGITNIINIFQPEIVAVGGGISAQGDVLLNPVRELVERDVYGGVLKTKIVTAELGNDAGIVGAAMLGLL